MNIRDLANVQILCGNSKEIESVASIMNEYRFIHDTTGDFVEVQDYLFSNLIRKGLITQLFIESPRIFGGYMHCPVTCLYEEKKYTPIQYGEFVSMAYPNEEVFECDMSVLGV